MSIADDAAHPEQRERHEPVVPAAAEKAGDGAPDAPSGEIRHHRDSQSTGDLQSTGDGEARPADGAFADLAPLFATRDAEPGAEPAAGRLTRLANYGANAAFVVVVLGFAFAAGTYFFGAQTPDKPVAQTVLRESAEMMRRTQQLVDEIGALRTNVDAMRASLAQAQAGKDQRSLEKSVDGLKARLDAVKSESASALAELSGKVDRLQRDPTLKQVAERLDKIEKQTALPTGSIAPLAKAATQDQKAGAPKSQPAAEASRRPQLIASWVVRDVYHGVALVESARGSMEVAPGDVIPGAGSVKSIERRGGGWIVITSRGLIDNDHALLEP